MEKPLVFIKREQAVMDWVPATSDVASVLVYRSIDNIQDSLGSRSLIGSVTPSSNTFTDTTSGSIFNVYRIRFISSTGSSPLSDAITPITSDILAQIGEVKLASKISANSDLGSDEVYASIKDASNWVYREYGDPIKKTAIFILSDTPTETGVYDFTGDMGPVYQVRRITANTNPETLISGSSYTIDFNNGQIHFTSAFIADNEGQYVRIEWVPQAVNDLVKFKAALDLTEAGMIIDGKDVKNTRMERLKRNVEEIRETLRPRAVYAAKLIDTMIIDSDPTNVSSWADFVGQKINRSSLQFS